MELLPIELKINIYDYLDVEAKINFALAFEIVFKWKDLEKYLSSAAAKYGYLDIMI
jgi:hypothetical protein